MTYKQMMENTKPGMAYSARDENGDFIVIERMLHGAITRKAISANEVEITILNENGETIEKQIGTADKYATPIGELNGNNQFNEKKMGS